MTDQNGKRRSYGGSNFGQTSDDSMGRAIQLSQEERRNAAWTLVEMSDYDREISREALDAMGLLDLPRRGKH